MRSLYQSLEEVCVKDMLEGDNKYTCSQCGTKVFNFFFKLNFALFPLYMIHS